MLAALLYEHINYAGYTYPVNDGENLPAIPPPMGADHGQASSMYVYSPQWITFWESPNYDQGDDSLWIAPPKPGHRWEFANLHQLGRPHGTNHWGDRIRCVSFSGGPTGSNENRTVVHEDGRVSIGSNRFTARELSEKFGITVQQVSLYSELVPSSVNKDEYNLPYRAVTDTEWISNPNSPDPKTGTISKGTVVLFNREPSSLGATWQDAILDDGTLRFVHPSDFQK